MKPYEILKKYEAFALRIFNFYASIKILLRCSKLRNLKKNASLKNSASTDTCFILMGGLSVQEVDLKKLYGKDVITANNYFKSDDYMKVRPKYHVITDAEFFSFDDNINDLNQKIQDFTTLILNAKCAPVKENRNWNYIYPIYRVLGPNLKVDLSRPCSNFSTVTLTCIQLAIYLGYKKINLVGFDFPPGHMPHYYKESEDERRGVEGFYAKVKEYDYCELFWQYTNCQHEAYKLNEFSRSIGVEIFNTSKMSFVRAFPYKNFQET